MILLVCHNEAQRRGSYGFVTVNIDRLMVKDKDSESAGILQWKISPQSIIGNVSFSVLFFQNSIFSTQIVSPT